MDKSIITVTQLHKFAHKRVILSDVSFDISKKSLVSLIGPNGAGKSTLVKIILGHDTDYQGVVVIDEQETVAYIPQIDPRDPNTIPLSVQEYLYVAANSLYSKIKPSLSDLEKMLTHVGVSADKLTQSFWNLSGGERQRVAIARALITEPTILVLDEPLSAVDYASRKDLYELIRHLQQGHDMTVLLISHDIDSVLPISDRVLCLNQTLHSDCHPCEYSDSTFTSGSTGVHHHC